MDQEVLKGAEEDSYEGGPKKSRKKLIVILVVVAAAIVVTSVGFSVWHSSPTFCNAICHRPMDFYVEGYRSAGSTALVATHAHAGLKCLDCHEPSLGAQIAEASRWVSGDFKVDTNGMIADSGGNMATREFCWRCHNDGNPSDGKDWAAITEATASWSTTMPEVNPHAAHTGVTNCGSCHSMHGTSTLACDGCHDFRLPDGWAKPKKN